MNVLLVIMDSVRAANTSLHGHENTTTPFLEEFGTEATVYTQARSPGTWSLPSHTSIFTGFEVCEHGVVQARDKLEPGHTIFEELRDERGYETGIFSENTWVTEMDVGLKEAFTTVEGSRNTPYTAALDPTNFVLSEGQGEYWTYVRECLKSGRPLQSLLNGVVTKLAWDHPQLLPSRFKASTPAQVYADRFLDWVQEREGDWAACINFMDGHLPYEPDDDCNRWGGGGIRKLQDSMEDHVWEFLGGQRPWWQRKALEALYDGAIFQIDQQIERIVAGLRRQRLLDDTLLVITSDHGEGFGEPSRVRPGTRLSGHGKGIHETLVHVPLLVRYPGQTDSHVVEEVSTLTRFPAVVRQVVDGNVPERGFAPDGPVVASTHGLDEPSEKLATRYCGRTAPYDGTCRAVYEDASDAVVKYAKGDSHGATVKIFDAKSSIETGDVGAGRVEEVFADFEDAGVRVSGTGVQDIDQTTQRRLEDLGYM